MKWSEVAERIKAMTPEQQDQPALIFDESEGRFAEIKRIEENDSEINNMPYIVEKDHWFEPKG